MTQLLTWLALAGVVSAVEPADVSADLEPFRRGGKIPALAAAAVLDGKIVAIGATGIRKHGEPAAVTVEDKFHIGSCTKSMTATVAGMLVADGKIHWESTVTEVFPEVKIHPEFRQATLLQLCSNSGGAPSDFPPKLWRRMVTGRDNPEAGEREAAVRYLLENAPIYPPGSKRVYSNGGFMIAGAMIEKAAGKPYDELLRERLFQPLGMTGAGFGAPAGNDQPWGHLRRLGFTLPIEPGPDADNPPAMTPAGRVHLTISDFARYAMFHLSADEADFLHEPVPPGDDYASGWVVLNRPWAGGRALMHTGSNTMNHAVIWLAPGRKFGAVATCNTGDPAGAEACDDAVSFLIRRFLEK